MNLAQGVVAGAVDELVRLLWIVQGRVNVDQISITNKHLLAHLSAICEQAQESWGTRATIGE